jgi:uncharacterized protein (TIGR04255 family)
VCEVSTAPRPCLAVQTSSTEKKVTVTGQRPRLPSRISPCPIVGAVAEIRFQTDLRATAVPGMIYGAVRERFPSLHDAPGVNVPEEIRAIQPALAYQPVLVAEGEHLALHVGHKNLFLGMREKAEYPGWAVYRDALVWVTGRLRPLNLIKEPERLGLRYTDFFDPPLVERLKVELRVGGQLKTEGSVQVIYQFRRDGFTGRVRVDTGAIFSGPQPRRGIILDVDLGFSLASADFWEKLIVQFDLAHDLQKEIFYGELLQEHFLATLNPQYD